MIFELVAVGSLIFWLMISTLIIAIVTTIETKSFGLATFIVLFSILFLQLFTNFNPFGYIYTNPVTSLLYVFLYFVVGAFWAVAKWYFYCLAVAKSYSDLRTAWIEQYNKGHVNQLDIDSMSLNDKQTMMRAIIIEMPLKYGRQIPPHVGSNKVTITGWIALWPFSAAWTLLNDPVKHVTQAVYAHIGSTMQNISNRIFSKKFSELN